MFRLEPAKDVYNENQFVNGKDDFLWFSYHLCLLEVNV